MRAQLIFTAWPSVCATPLTANLYNSFHKHAASLCERGALLQAINSRCFANEHLLVVACLSTLSVFRPLDRRYRHPSLKFGTALAVSLALSTRSLTPEQHKYAPRVFHANDIHSLFLEQIMRNNYSVYSSVIVCHCARCII